MSDYIITLSSIPPRFSSLGPTLESLVRQTLKPEKIILYLSRSYRRFPDWDGELPKVPDGVEIRMVDEDYGPATKILPAVRDFRDKGYEILFCDDDQLYRPNMAARFLKERARKPNAALAISGIEFAPVAGQKRQFRHEPRRIRLWRAADPIFQSQYFVGWLRQKTLGLEFLDPPRRPVLRAGYADVFEGFRGVMVRPEFFPEECFDIPDFARHVDDFWLSGHLMRNGHPTWIMAGVMEPRQQRTHHAETALYRSHFDGKGREDLNAQVRRYFQENYGIWH